MLLNRLKHTTKNYLVLNVHDVEVNKNKNKKQQPLDWGYIEHGSLSPSTIDP